MDGNHGHKLASSNLPVILQHQLNQQRQAGRFCDIKLRVQESELNAHYCVLAALSPLICGQVQSENTSELQLPPILTTRGVEPLLEWMYTSELTLSRDNLLDVSFAAGYFQVEEVAKLCQTFQQNLQHGGSTTSQVDEHVPRVQQEFMYVSEEQHARDCVLPDAANPNYMEAVQTSDSKAGVKELASVSVKTEEVPSHQWGIVADNTQFIPTSNDDTKNIISSVQQQPLHTYQSVSQANTPLPPRDVYETSVTNSCETNASAYTSLADSHVRDNDHGRLASNSVNFKLSETPNSVEGSSSEHHIAEPPHDADYTYPGHQSWEDQMTTVNVVSSTGEGGALSTSPHESPNNNIGSVTQYENNSPTTNPPTTPDRSQEIRIVAVVGSCRKLFYGEQFCSPTAQSSLVDTTCYGTPPGSSEHGGTADAPEVTFSGDEKPLDNASQRRDGAEDTPVVSGSPNDDDELFITYDSKGDDNITPNYVQENDSSAIRSPCKDCAQKLPDEGDNEKTVTSMNAEEATDDEDRNAASCHKEAELKSEFSPAFSDIRTNSPENAEITEGGKTQATSTTDTDADNLQDSNCRDLGDDRSRETEGGHGILPRYHDFADNQQEENYFQEQKEKKKRAFSDSVDPESPSRKRMFAQKESAAPSRLGSTAGAADDVTPAPLPLTSQERVQGDQSPSASEAASTGRSLPEKREETPSVHPTFVKEGDQDWSSAAIRRVEIVYRGMPNFLQDETTSVVHENRPAVEQKNLDIPSYVDHEEEVGPEVDEKQRNTRKKNAEDRKCSSSETVSSSKQKQRNSMTSSSDLSKDRTDSPSRVPLKKRSHRHSTKSQRESTAEKAATTSVVLDHRPPHEGNTRRVSQLRTEDIDTFHPVSPPSPKLLNCYFCIRQFDNEDARVHHLQMEHPGKIPYRCGYCSAGFLYHSQLSLHISTYHKNW